MKRKTLNRVLAVLVLATIFLGACTKEKSEVRLAPTLATTQFLNVTSNAATVVGLVIAAGDGFTEKGICYNTATAPTIANNKVVYSGAGTSAAFNVTLTGLAYATSYFARAYATGADGTIYGEEVTFITEPVIPTVTTTIVTDIKGTSATSGGNVTVTGGADVTERGVCFSTNLNPTYDDTKTSDGIGTGVFVSKLANLKGLTKYHVRAYAKNKAGTAYGADLTFTTLVSIRNWNIPGDYVAASYPGSTLKDWDPANSPMVKSLEAVPNNIEGYVYMSKAINEWKFASQPNWDGPNYGDGGAGKLDANGGNFKSPAGYYKINVNAAVEPMTYTAVATSWGVIGDASPNAWNDETALTYDPTSGTWKGGMHLTAGAFKFRANHSWDFNYGSDLANGILTAGGGNIPTTLVGDYMLTLDLSHPNAYTYSANTWGLIGSATADGWNSDQNLTWDAANKVLKITANLVVGEIKFRANDKWDLALGGTVGALTTSGGNIAITVAGNYTITLDLSKANYTCIIKKN